MKPIYERTGRTVSKVMDDAREYARGYIREKGLDAFEVDPSRDAASQLEDLSRRHALYVLVMGALEDPSKAWDALGDKASDSVMSFVNLENSKNRSLKLLIEENRRRRMRVAGLRDGEGVERYRGLYSEELEILDAYALYALVGLLYQEDDEKAVEGAGKAKTSKVARQAKGAAGAIASRAVEDALESNPNMGRIDQEELYDSEYNAAYVAKMDELYPARDKTKDSEALSPKRKERAGRVAKKAAQAAKREHGERNPEADKEELCAVYEAAYAEAYDREMGRHG